MIELLFTTLAVPIGKLLLKNFLGETSSSIGGGLLDLAQKKIEDYEDRREAKRQFEKLGEQITKCVLPLFKSYQASHNDLNFQAVAHELSQTLEGNISAEFFVTRDLDPVDLTTALKYERPLPEKQFSEIESNLYDWALAEIVRYIVDVADQLPKFETALAAQSLSRLSVIQTDIAKALESNQRIERSVDSLLKQKTSQEEKIVQYEIAYRQAAIRKLDYVELFGADFGQESRR